MAELSALLSLAARRPSLWLLAATLACAWPGLNRLEALLGWSSGGSEGLNQAVGVVWLCAAGLTLGYCLMAPAMGPIRRAMSPRGALIAASTSALLVSAVGAGLALAPALLEAPRHVELTRIALRAGVATVQIAGLALTAWVLSRKPSQQPMVFLVLAWLLPAALGSRIGPLLSGAWTGDASGASMLAGPIFVWCLAFATASGVTTGRPTQSGRSRGAPA